MDTILVAVIILVLIIMSTLIITVTVFQSANNLGDAWKDMESQSISISDTEILVTGNYTGELIDVAVQNEGRTNLYDYPNWDVIIQYQSGDAFHLSYVEASPPGSGEWAIEGIFMAGGSLEVFNPNILDPGEVMNVAINPEMEIGIGETARIVISTPNGVTSPCFVTRE
jgi:hypothetical protein